MAKLPISIDEVNNLDCAEFTNTFKNVIENCGIVAFRITNEYFTKDRGRPYFHNIMDLYCAFCDVLDFKDIPHKRKILVDTPGLKKHLSELVNLITEEKYELTRFIRIYERKFGFSFVICENENKISDILAKLKERVSNDHTTEINNGVEELKKIAKYRILQIIKHEYA